MITIPQHEQKNCPRCKRVFACKVGNVLECQCAQIQLSYEEKMHIENAYTDCLCIDCLHVLGYQYQLKKNKSL